jgi:hypothetical protein
MLHTLWVKWVQTVIMQCSPYKRSWNNEICRKFSHASSRATLYHFKNIFLFLQMLLTCSFRWNMSTGKRTPFTQCIENLGKHSMIRNSAHKKESTVFFNSSSGTTIAEAVNLQHISTFAICEDVWRFSQQSYNATVNSHNGQQICITSHGVIWFQRLFWYQRILQP